MSTVDVLNGRLQGFLERKFFKTVVAGLIFMNPVALAPQVWTAFTAPSVEGISLTMWVIFAAIQAAVIFEGIRVRSAPMFWSMLISVFQSITIIIVVLARG
ncbi:MAG: hypothetical protein UY69_C0013G0007 [Parcubacteria group bacterium GW2011_GWF1_52_5]|nr:MAG: hypothetical protein UY69_C0013G0007 [Parcubacteria group bacterium GW2011_GWF1_52_5]